MNIDRYLVMTCNWKALTSDSSDEYGIAYDSSVIPLKCYKWNNNGQNFRINGMSIEAKSLTSYIIKNQSVKEGDLIDGLVVESIAKYTDLKGNYLFSHCGVN